MVLFHFQGRAPRQFFNMPQENRRTSGLLRSPKEFTHIWMLRSLYIQSIEFGSIHISDKKEMLSHRKNISLHNNFYPKFCLLPVGYDIKFRAFHNHPKFQNLSAVCCTTGSASRQTSFWHMINNSFDKS